MPKALLLDIETTPTLSYHWGMYKQNIANNQIHKEWEILSFAAKWLGSDKIIYLDKRNKKMLQTVWELIDECDILITHNGKSFDSKKLNAQFVLAGYPPPSSHKHIDTLRIAKSKFAFTSNKLEYLSDKLCSHKKDKHAKFPGFELWLECMNNNKAAWRELEKYNRKDILALEDLYKKLYPWAAKINFNLYRNDLVNKCHCGSTKFQKNGFALTEIGRYQRYQCSNCGTETRDGVNLLTKEKRATLKRCISG
jgi:DNA polymerase elongation subunit (family B)